MADDAAIGRNLDWITSLPEIGVTRQQLDRAFARASPKLVRLLAGMGFASDDRDDILQDAYLQALQARDSLRHVDRLEAWLVRITVNKAATEYRRRKRFSQHAPRLAARTPTAATDPNTDDQETIRAALDRLPSEQSAVLVLRYFCDYTSARIGQALDLNPNTVRSRLAAARNALAAALKPDFGDRL